MAGDTNSEIIELFFQVSRSMKENMTYETDIANLSLLQLFTLTKIERSQENVHMKDIAEYFSIEMPTATSIINKLERLNLVRRTTDPKDRRGITITLSKKGKETLEKVTKKHKQRIEKTLSYLSARQKQDLHSILKTLAAKI